MKQLENIMTMKIFIYDSSANTGREYIDRYGVPHDSNTVLHAEPFGSHHEAKEYIESKGWGTWATVTMVAERHEIECGDDLVFDDED